MEYLILVNKDNALNKSYFDDVYFEEYKDSFGNINIVEKESLKQFLRLKELLKDKKINIEIDNAYRTIEEQQKIIDDYTNKYGAIYVNKYVAPINKSEHHTGLAIDIALVIAGEKIIDPDKLFENDDIFLEIHKYLSNFGFILRYPKDKENITGYNYEPWHIRYVGKDIAKDIANRGLTLEEYICINNIHTTRLGRERISNNLNINCDSVDFLKEMILNKNRLFYRKGKNYYCEVDGIVITINAYNYCIITVHRKK